MYRKYIKRLIDIALSSITLIILSPLILVVAILTRIKLGSPVIFKQKRPGKNEKLFVLYKFRTMTDKKDENGVLLPDMVRLTKFGMFLRKTSLDELPEFFNILKGDMSFVGPRPLLVQYLPLYNDRQKRRHDVRPGLSGLAQVNGRNAISWEDKFEFDIKYIENVGFITDLKIILKTFKKVFLQEDINSMNAATMEVFTGTDEEIIKNESIENKLLIIGAGGHGKVCADIAIKMYKWKQIYFLDDNENIKSSMGIEVIGRISDLHKFINDYDLFVAIGNNYVRELIQNKIEAEGANVQVLIHPSAIIGEQVTIDKGSVIMAGAIINCCSSIAKGVIINTGATIDHDNIIADYAHISPGVNTAGLVHIGNKSWVGIGASIINNVNVSDNVTIGAGAVVIKDALEEGTYIGVPARRIK